MVRYIISGVNIIKIKDNDINDIRDKDNENNEVKDIKPKIHKKIRKRKGGELDGKSEEEW
ncbi:MAG: hypothetical protein NC820_07055 [Candidatus Omnitrophica bacterium]|nr:hypothetical protein [Candidatus Omnitrophota bacterium]